ncbi:sodium-translocating pyrophosphatase [Candidatus Woesearchaeota archaeon]|nr:sodium-translocating pyrophosphatase [Candidatus Woesearchaeota archaeon]
MNYNILIVMLISILTLIFANILYRKIIKHSPGTKKMQEISAAIREGAITFLKREYKILSIFIVLLTLVIVFLLDEKNTLHHEGIAIAISCILGAICSVLSGVIGMRTATIANVRTTNAAKKDLHSALDVAFSSGSIMGLSVVALGLLGLTVLFTLFSTFFGFSLEFIVKVISGFGLGASSIALFARVGGGIYTKAADVGADLVGKVEKNIPEDDPRNPAVIADNVGDNVGDVAGMGADLFESYVGSIIAAMTIGLVTYDVNGVYLPLAIAAGGIIASIIATIFVKLNKKPKNPEGALKYGLLLSTFGVIIISYFVTDMLIPGWGLYIAILSGLLAGTFIGLVTEYYTSSSHHPTQKVSEAAQTGSATAIIDGLSLGYRSTLIPVLLISAAIWLSYRFGGLYGIALSAVGMLSTLGYSLATDAYGPVADNAGGIAEMSRLPKKVRNITDKLDSAGNTTAAIGKGFAIGSAALTTLALFSAFITAAGIKVIDISQPLVIIGLLIGGMLPFIFSALTMNAVGKAAQTIVEEVRKQFKQKKGLMSGKDKPDYTKCVDIATKSSLVEMIMPGVIAILAPIFVGVLLGAEALGGLLAGSLITGILLAISMANSGGSWDNAKKYIEEGHYGGKGSDAHKASVVGDTVGDPFKDTSGPALNILIKLMSIVSLVFVVLFI